MRELFSALPFLYRSLSCATDVLLFADRRRDQKEGLASK